MRASAFALAEYFSKEVCWSKNKQYVNKNDIKNDTSQKEKKERKGEKKEQGKN